MVECDARKGGALIVGHRLPLKFSVFFYIHRNDRRMADALKSPRGTSGAQ